MQIAGERHIDIDERHERRSPAAAGSILVEIETDKGSTSVEGSVVLGRARLLQVDGIYCESPLDGNLTYCKNRDVPGVIGFIGTVLGHNGVNIANFALGRQDRPVRPGDPLEAMSVIQSDQPVPESVLVQLMENPGMKMARTVELAPALNARGATN
jgi:D-3-phosphoglycerate dehydrogenase